MFFVLPWPPTQLRDRPNISPAFERDGLSPCLILPLRFASARIHSSSFSYLNSHLANRFRCAAIVAILGKGLTEGFNGSCCSFLALGKCAKSNDRPRKNYDVCFRICDDAKSTRHVRLIEIVILWPITTGPVVQPTNRKPRLQMSFCGEDCFDAVGKNRKGANTLRNIRKPRIRKYIVY